MPLYEYECPKCGTTHNRIRAVEDCNAVTICPHCRCRMTKLFSVCSMKVFKSQFVGATTIDKDGNDVTPYVRNKQELTDAINRHNDSERASKTGRVAILE